MNDTVKKLDSSFADVFLGKTIPHNPDFISVEEHNKEMAASFEDFLAVVDEAIIKEREACGKICTDNPDMNATDLADLILRRKPMVKVHD
jgi:hypothetical protein